MSQEWGRENYAGEWPSEVPAWIIGAVCFALLCAAAIGYYVYAWRMTPLQRYYLPAYAGSQVAGAMRKDGRYTLIEVVTRKEYDLALDDQVIPIVTSDGKSTFALTNEVRERGALRLEWKRQTYDNAQLHAYLAYWIYHGQTLIALLKPALWGGLIAFVLAMCVAVRKEAKRTRGLKEGLRLKGPELVTAQEFNERLNGNGIEFQLKQTLSDRLVGNFPVLRLPRGIEAYHILIVGDSGMGKGVLVRQIIRYARSLGQPVIVYDPALEYTPEFFNPRHDLILNPRDKRTLAWALGDEFHDEAEALTIATSLFPDRPHENSFFYEAPRGIFAYLLFTFRPTPQELLRWMSNAAEIDRRLAGTEYAAMIDKDSPAQRNGVLGSFNMLASALRLLPSAEEAGGVWSTLGWAKERKGNVFLTSTPTTRKQLLPLFSLWIDLFVLRTMIVGTEEQDKLPPVWFILDELASLQWLPQLHTAITENRKSNNPVVLAFQGRSQLEAIYGHRAEVMLSQPSTKIFLRNSEPRAARWISEVIGEIEVERKRESRSTGEFPQQRGSRTHVLDRQIEPLVMASEIAGLGRLRGYLKLDNLVVRMAFPYIKPLKLCKGFIERVMKKTTRALPEPSPAATEDSGGAAGQKAVAQEMTQNHRQTNTKKREFRRGPLFE
jgi:Type IV secretion-system coupling protein DNA-binding domain